MEDVDFVFDSVEISNQSKISLYGVLDGHGGRKCVDFAFSELPKRIIESIKEGNSPPDALYKSFVSTDQLFLSSVESSENSGCTANVLLYQHETNIFYVANTGDTRTILCRNKSLKSDIANGVNNNNKNIYSYDLTIDRKATDPEEISRIIKAGGFVANGRVLGSLAISRAVGLNKLL